MIPRTLKASCSMQLRWAFDSWFTHYYVFHSWFTHYVFDSWFTHYVVIMRHNPHSFFSNYWSLWCILITTWIIIFWLPIIHLPKQIIKINHPYLPPSSPRHIYFISPIPLAKILFNWPGVFYQFMPIYSFVHYLYNEVIFQTFFFFFFFGHKLSAQLTMTSTLWNVLLFNAIIYVLKY